MFASHQFRAATGEGAAHTHSQLSQLGQTPSCRLLLVQLRNSICSVLSEESQNGLSWKGPLKII